MMNPDRLSISRKRRWNLLSPQYQFNWRGAVVPLLLIVVAQLAAFESPAGDRVAPSGIAAAFWQATRDGSLLLQTAQTIWSVLLGLCLGGVSGLCLGIAFGLSSSVDRLMMFTVESIRPIPSAAFIPIVLLIFGFGYQMEVVLIAVGAIFPILIYTRAAIASTEPRLIELSRALGFNVRDRIFKIILPAALPRIFVGFRLSAALALVVGVTVEVSVNPQGLGSGIMIAEQTIQPNLMYAELIWVAMVGWLMNSGLLWVQRRLFGPPGVRPTGQR